MLPDHIDNKKSFRAASQRLRALDCSLTSPDEAGQVTKPSFKMEMKRDRGSYLCFAPPPGLYVFPSTNG